MKAKKHGLGKLLCFVATNQPFNPNKNPYHILYSTKTPETLL